MVSQNVSYFGICQMAPFGVEPSRLTVEARERIPLLCDPKYFLLVQFWLQAKLVKVPGNLEALFSPCLKSTVQLCE